MKMDRHFIVESLSAIDAARAVMRPGERAVWHTTSPYLLSELPRRGEDAICMEEGLAQDAMQRLGHASYEFADKACALLDEACSWREYAGFDMVFGLSFANHFYATFYKGMLLERTVERCGAVSCVGDPVLSGPRGMSPGFARFDTLYAGLAAMAGMPGVDVVEHVTPPERLAELERGVSARGMGPWEKLLSILNNTPGSFVCKTWRFLNRRGLLGTVALRPRPRKRFFVHKDCELIDEAFLGLLARGASFSRMPGLPCAPCAPATLEALPGAGALREGLCALALDTLRAYGLAHAGVAQVCAELLAHRLLLCVEALRSGLQSLTRGFDAVVRQMGDGAEVLTNFFASPVERLFGLYCLDRGVAVTAFEHGVTLGLSAWARLPVRFWGMALAQTGVYHSRISLKDLDAHLGGQRRLLAGMPKVTNRVVMPRLQRLLGRKWLGIGRGEHVVMYVADLERNNFMYGPYSENDEQFVRKTVAVVDELVARFPDSRVVLKLYPAYRYQENYVFGRLADRHSRVTIVQDMDFRFIRAAADVLAVTSSQSTLGWVLGAGRTGLFLEQPWLPSDVPGMAFECESVPEISRAIVLYNACDLDSEAHPRNVMRLMDADGGKGD